MRLVLVLLMLFAFWGSARAQEPPACDSGREGVAACLAGRLCLCRFVPGGSMTGRPDRHAWDCGLLRPACGAGLVPPSLPSQAPRLPPLIFPAPPQKPGGGR